MSDDLKKLILLEPVSHNLIRLIEHLKTHPTEVTTAEVAILSTLLPIDADPSAATRSIVATSQLIESHQSGALSYSHNQNALLPLDSGDLRFPATSQLCYVNGLSEIEWFENRFVRKCTEDRVMQMQALPCLTYFEFSIVGQFQSQVSLSVYCLNNSIEYTSMLLQASETDCWVTSRFGCSATKADNTSEEAINLCEVVARVTPGDLFLEFVYHY